MSGGDKHEERIPTGNMIDDDDVEGFDLDKEIEDYLQNLECLLSADDIMELRDDPKKDSNEQPVNESMNDITNKPPDIVPLTKEAVESISNITKKLLMNFQGHDTLPNCNETSPKENIITVEQCEIKSHKKIRLYEDEITTRYINASLKDDKNGKLSQHHTQKSSNFYKKIDIVDARVARHEVQTGKVRSGHKKKKKKRKRAKESLNENIYKKHSEKKKLQTSSQKFHTSILNTKEAKNDQHSGIEDVSDCETELHTFENPVLKIEKYSMKKTKLLNTEILNKVLEDEDFDSSLSEKDTIIFPLNKCRRTERGATKQPGSKREEREHFYFTDDAKELLAQPSVAPRSKETQCSLDEPFKRQLNETSCGFDNDLSHREEMLRRKESPLPKQGTISYMNSSSSKGREFGKSPKQRSLSFSSLSISSLSSVEEVQLKTRSILRRSQKEKKVLNYTKHSKEDSKKKLRSIVKKRLSRSKSPLPSRRRFRRLSPGRHYIRSRSRSPEQWRRFRSRSPGYRRKSYLRSRSRSRHRSRSSSLLLSRSRSRSNSNRSRANLQRRKWPSRSPSPVWKKTYPKNVLSDKVLWLQTVSGMVSSTEKIKAVISPVAAVETKTSTPTASAVAATPETEPVPAEKPATVSLSVKPETSPATPEVIPIQITGNRVRIEYNYQTQSYQPLSVVKQGQFSRGNGQQYTSYQHTGYRDNSVFNSPSGFCLQPPTNRLSCPVINTSIPPPGTFQYSYPNQPTSMPFRNDVPPQYQPPGFSSYSTYPTFMYQNGLLPNLYTAPYCSMVNSHLPPLPPEVPHIQPPPPPGSPPTEPPPEIPHTQHTLPSPVNSPILRPPEKSTSAEVEYLETVSKGGLVSRIHTNLKYLLPVVNSKPPPAVLEAINRALYTSPSKSSTNTVNCGSETKAPSSPEPQHHLQGEKAAVTNTRLPGESPEKCKGVLRAIPPKGLKVKPIMLRLSNKRILKHNIFASEESENDEITENSKKPKLYCPTTDISLQQSLKRTETSLSNQNYDSIESSAQEIPEDSVLKTVGSSQNSVSNSPSSNSNLKVQKWMQSAAAECLFQRSFTKDEVQFVAKAAVRVSEPIKISTKTISTSPNLEIEPNDTLLKTEILDDSRISPSVAEKADVMETTTGHQINDKLESCPTSNSAKQNETDMHESSEFKTSSTVIDFSLLPPSSEVKKNLPSIFVNEESCITSKLPTTVEELNCQQSVAPLTKTHDMTEEFPVVQKIATSEAECTISQAPTVEDTVDPTPSLQSNLEEKSSESSALSSTGNISDIIQSVDMELEPREISAFEACDEFFSVNKRTKSKRKHIENSQDLKKVKCLRPRRGHQQMDKEVHSLKSKTGCPKGVKQDGKMEREHFGDPSPKKVRKQHTKVALLRGHQNNILENNLESVQMTLIQHKSKAVLPGVAEERANVKSIKMNDDTSICDVKSSGVKKSGMFLCQLMQEEIGMKDNKLHDKLSSLKSTKENFDMGPQEVEANMNSREVLSDMTFSNIMKPDQVSSCQSDEGCGSTKCDEAEHVGYSVVNKDIVPGQVKLSLCPSMKRMGGSKETSSLSSSREGSINISCRNQPEMCPIDKNSYQHKYNEINRESGHLVISHKVAKNPVSTASKKCSYNDTKGSVYCLSPRTSLSYSLAELLKLLENLLKQHHTLQSLQVCSNDSKLQKIPVVCLRRRSHRWRAKHTSTPTVKTGYRAVSEFTKPKLKSTKEDVKIKNDKVDSASPCTSSACATHSSDTVNPSLPVTSGPGSTPLDVPTDTEGTSAHPTKIEEDTYSVSCNLETIICPLKTTSCTNIHSEKLKQSQCLVKTRNSRCCQSDGESTLKQIEKLLCVSRRTVSTQVDLCSKSLEGTMDEVCTEVGINIALMNALRKILS